MTPRDAVVVLGCCVQALTGAPSPALGRRLELAAHAFGRGAAPLVVVSGGRRWGPYVEADVMRRELRRAGVPDQAIVAERCSLTTLDNALFCAERLGQLGIRRALLVTCSWHLPRALRNFRHFGVAAVAPPADWLPALRPPRLELRTRVRERLSYWADALRLSSAATRWEAGAS